MSVDVHRRARIRSDPGEGKQLVELTQGFLSRCFNSHYLTSCLRHWQSVPLSTHGEITFWSSCHVAGTSLLLSAVRGSGREDSGECPDQRSVAAVSQVVWLVG